MPTNQYHVKVPLDSQDLPTEDGLVLFNSTDKDFEVKNVSDLRSTNICIEYKIMKIPNPTSLVPSWTYENSDLGTNVPDSNEFAGRAGTTATTVNYPPEAYNGGTNDLIYFGYRSGNSNFTTYLRDVADDDNNKIIVFASNSNFPEQFFAFEANVSQVGSGTSTPSVARTQLTNVNFMDYQYSPSRNTNISLSTTNTSNNFWLGNSTWNFIFLDPNASYDGNGKFTSGTAPSSVHNPTKNLILTATDLNGNDVKNYLVAEGGGRIKFTDKSNNENYIIRNFQRSFILRGKNHFSNKYYVVFTNLETIAESGTYEDEDATYCVEVMPTDMGHGTNTTGGTPNVIYSPLVTHRQRFQDYNELLRIGRRYEGGYRSGNPYGFDNSVAGAEISVNCWVNTGNTPNNTYRSSGTFSQTFGDDGVASSPLLWTSANIMTRGSNGIGALPVFRPEYLRKIDDVGAYLVLKFSKNDNWPEADSSAWVTTRIFYTNRN